MLKKAEVRTDKGKFVSTAWEVLVDGVMWCVVIGFERTMKTVFRTASYKQELGESILRSGALYDFVAQVNRDLMADEDIAATTGGAD